MELMTCKYFKLSNLKYHPILTVPVFQLLVYFQVKYYTGHFSEKN